MAVIRRHGSLVVFVLVDCFIGWSKNDGALSDVSYQIYMSTAFLYQEIADSTDLWGSSSS
jgi:hypothetical protein